MYRKNCEKCKRPSYSSSEFGVWLCPTCGTDLTPLPFFHAVTFEQVHVNRLLINKQLNAYSEQNIQKSQ